MMRNDFYLNHRSAATERLIFTEMQKKRNQLRFRIRKIHIMLPVIMSDLWTSGM